MNAVVRPLALLLALTAGMALADEATGPIPARKALMDSYGTAAKTLAGMIAGKIPFDAAGADAAKAVLAGATGGIPPAFKAMAVDSSSKAKGAIWSDWDDFIARAKAAGDAAAALDTTSAEALAPGFDAMGEACKGCHSAYRM